jgi:tetratricopeptide (TPR) repeat protein
MSISPQASAPSRRLDYVLAATLAVLTFATFLPALQCEFVNFDDPHYITNNPRVTGGLTPQNIGWALTVYRTNYWHPLTWLSLQLDASLWWPGALGFHLTNILLHSCNATLLFFALYALTGARWRSAAVALLFAVHPLRVESVAWVTERKDVLSSFFGFLALWGYAAYAHRPSVWRYLGLAVCFGLSLTAKPMLVTLPFLLLVLDWWPLGRWTESGWRKVVMEKLPLVVLAAGSAGMTIIGHLQKDTIRGLDGLTRAGRFGNAALSYVTYLAKTIWPTNLAVYHPHPLDSHNPARGLSLWAVIAAALVLTAVTALVIGRRNRAPYLLAGWLWYLGTLAPVIGIIQPGAQAYADRFTYFPQIGLLIALSWGITELASARPRVALAGGLAAALVLAVLSHAQLSVWHDSVALWEQNLRVTGPSRTTLCNLADGLEAQGRGVEAAQHYRESLAIDPDDVGARVNLGNTLAHLRNFDGARREFEKALRLNPDSDRIICDMGLVDVATGNLAAAAARFRQAIELCPESTKAHANLGNIYAGEGKLDEAVAEYREALRLEPESATEHFNLSGVLWRQGKLDQAVSELEEAVRLKPEFSEAHHRLGLIQAARGNLDHATVCLRAALRIHPSLVEVMDDLGLVLIRQGHADEGLSWLIAAVRQNPGSREAHINLAKAFETQAEFARAAAEYETVIKLDPSVASAWFDLGRTRMRLGMAADALPCLEKSVALDPSSTLYRKALNAARRNRDQFEATGSSSEANRLAPR